MLDLTGDFHHGTKQPIAAMHVQERFIQAQRFDEWRERKEDRANLPTDLRIMVHANGQENSLRTKSPCGGYGHRAMNAELASFVRCGADDTAALDAANDHGLAAQAGLVALFDGRIEGVHVHM